MDTEAQIRDYIAANLDLIESNLDLIDIEYLLKNNDQIYGYVDILAKDRFGNLVIIELKKSKNSARQAIHELHKYVGLIKQIHKVQDGKIRCILLSREWRELLIPFSNFVHRTPSYQIEGFEILVDNTGTPQNFEKISILSKEELIDEIRMSPHHMIYLYKNELRRSQAEPGLKKVIASIDSPFLIFSMEYKGDNSRVIFPFAHYVVPFAISFEKALILESQLGIVHGIGENEQKSWFLEQEILGFIGMELFAKRDDMEIGYAEKFDTCLATGWVIKEVIRFGQEISSKAIYSDDELTSKVKGIEGQHRGIYHVQSSPRYTVRWQEIKKELSYSLFGNEYWQSIVELYLNEIEVSNPNDDISITIYNPCNTLITLLKLSDGDSNHLPKLEIAIMEKETKRKRILFSTLHWDGKFLFRSPEKIIDNIFGNLDEFLFELHFGEVYLKEDLVLNAYGLFYDFEEFYIENEQIHKRLKLSIGGDELIRDFNKVKKTNSMEDFARRNKRYLLTLKRYFSKFSADL